MKLLSIFMLGLLLGTSVFLAPVFIDEPTMVASSDVPDCPPEDEPEDDDDEGG